MHTYTHAGTHSSLTHTHTHIPVLRHVLVTSEAAVVLAVHATPTHTQKKEGVLWID